MQATIDTRRQRRGVNPVGRPKVGRGKRWLLNLVNPDGTKVEFTEAHVVR